MRYPAGHKQATRERIVRSAARRFRSRGGEGAAIADLMRDLRLTHGGFYRHFGSKEDLFGEALEHGLQQVAARLAAAAGEARPGAELRAVVNEYLSTAHCRDVAGGCPLAALGCEVARHSATAQKVFQRALREHVERMAVYMPGATATARRRKAVLLFSGMAGALSLARAMPDERSRARILASARRFYLGAARR